MSGWRPFLALVGKDLVVERRTHQALATMFVFSLLVLVILSFAFELRIGNAQQVAPGALWVALAFAAVLGLNRSLAQEREDGCLEGLMLAPMERSTIYLAKAASNLLFLVATQAIVLPVFSVLLGVDVLRADLALVLFLGALGLAAAGTLVATMAAQTRAREVLLPVLLLPLSVPLLIAGAKATAGVLDGGGLAGVSGWLRLLAGFDVAWAAASYLISATILEE